MLIHGDQAGNKYLLLRHLTGSLTGWWDCSFNYSTLLFPTAMDQSNRLFKVFALIIIFLDKHNIMRYWDVIKQNICV